MIFPCVWSFDSTVVVFCVNDTTYCNWTYWNLVEIDLHDQKYVFCKDRYKLQ